jgi:hypothetical protein
MKNTNADRYLSFSEVVEMIQPRMPDKNAAALLLADGFGNPQIPWVERNGRRVYALSDVAAFMARVFRVTIDSEGLRRDARFHQRSGQERRKGRERRVAKAAKLDPLADRRKTPRERRQMSERRGRSSGD